MQQLITGIIASPGIKIGKAYVYHGSNLIIPKYTVEPESVEEELGRYRRTLEIGRAHV